MMSAFIPDVFGRTNTREVGKTSFLQNEIETDNTQLLSNICKISMTCS
jgi:hypothetical protein